MKIYIAGKITGDPYYKAKFARAAADIADARCPWRTPSGCWADVLELQPSAVYGTNCRRRQRRRRKKEE